MKGGGPGTGIGGACGRPTAAVAQVPIHRSRPCARGARLNGTTNSTPTATAILNFMRRF
jgi:hypothetical protein